VNDFARTRLLAGEWALGWARSRDVPAPVAEPDGFRIDINADGQLVRYVLAGPETTERRARTLTAPGTWLKVCGPRDEVIAALTPQWRVGEPEYLMSAELSAGPVVTSEPYTVGIEGDGDVLDAVVRAADGTQAARGRVAVPGACAVVDQVVTEPEHRRRGLGRLVMGVLSSIAVSRGATRAVLVATEDGLGLYRSIGWIVDSPVVAAHLPS
jgi:GNAT superfamily N-acetyltransferase